ncbi:MAG: restriction endonuclease [Gemmatimonadaceae bacterium]
MLRVGEARVTYNSRGGATYQVEMWHDGLRKHRLIRGSDISVVQRKAQLQSGQWTDQWRAVESKLTAERQRAHYQNEVEERKREAARRTDEARHKISQLQDLLKATLVINDVIDWDTLLDNSPFAQREPELENLGPDLSSPHLPPEPQPRDLRYAPQLGFFDRLIGSRKLRKEAAAADVFVADHALWASQSKLIEREYWKKVETRAAQLRAANERLNVETSEWERAKRVFLDAQAKSNEAVEAKHKLYLECDPEAVHDYCDLVLSKSEYPDYFPKEFQLQYLPDIKTIVVDYSLPAPDDLPSLREVKYVVSRGELVEQFIPDTQRVKLYDDVLYQIVLRTIHELFEADVAHALDAVVLNGYVTAVDRSKGKNVTACVLSLRSGKSEFEQIDLSNVEPRACFKALKGVGSSKLYGLSAIAPILQLRRDDGRFVAAHEVANTLDERTNLAAMDWEDFEHLIREVFEQEFAIAGGEVKVTRTSRDGGVDAIAFDPDPIRGGKIVIQAKRYTNTVGVSAVRDLYGTVMNEGANKGILVTTSDYGPDAYSFAAGKPLVLLNGSNLLYMMEKHGHPARINIAEARLLASEGLSG